MKAVDTKLLCFALTSYTNGVAFDPDNAPGLVKRWASTSKGRAFEAVRSSEVVEVRKVNELPEGLFPDVTDIDVGNSRMIFGIALFETNDGDIRAETGYYGTYAHVRNKLLDASIDKTEVIYVFEVYPSGPVTMMTAGDFVTYHDKVMEEAKKIVAEEEKKEKASA